jgi:hypothetical protein
MERSDFPKFSKLLMVEAFHVVGESRYIPVVGAVCSPEFVEGSTAIKIDINPFKSWL